MKYRLQRGYCYLDIIAAFIVGMLCWGVLIYLAWRMSGLAWGE